MLDGFLGYYDEVRPKGRQGWMSLMQYRRRLGLPHSRSKEMSAVPYLYVGNPSSKGLLLNPLPFASHGKR